MEGGLPGSSLDLTRGTQLKVSKTFLWYKIEMDNIITAD